MIDRKIVTFIAGAAKGQQILTALQIHLLCKGDLLLFPGFAGFQKGLFKHGIGSADLRTLYILKGQCKDRGRHVLSDLHFHMHGALRAFHYRINAASLRIRHEHFRDLCLAGAVFQRFHICNFFRISVLRCIFRIPGYLRILGTGVFGSGWFRSHFFFYRFRRCLILPHQHLLVDIQHLLRRTLAQLLSLFQQDHAVAVFCNARHIVTYEQDRLTLLLKFFEFVIAFRLEEHIADRKCFVHDQDFRLDIDSQRKGQTHEHTGGIGLHRLMYKVPDIGKSQDIVQLGIDLFFGKTDHRAVQIDILQPRIFGIKSGSQFQQGGNAPVYVHLAGSGIQHTGNDL